MRLKSILLLLSALLTASSAFADYRQNTAAGGVTTFSSTVDGSSVHTPNVNATITPSGIQNTNITQILGAAPSLTNPIWITPATGAVFALPAAGTSVVGTKVAGTAAATSLLIGGVYNTTVPVLTDGQQAARQADTAGSNYINTEGRKATYSASGLVTIAASATDVFTITGSASKTVRVLRVQLSGTATAATVTPVYLIRRAANTGGTSTSPAIPGNDSANAAASATILNYSANPTTGTTSGLLRRQHIGLPTTAGAGAMSNIIWEFGTRPGQAAVLRGTNETLSINFNGATVGGGSVTVDIEWTEE